MQKLKTRRTWGIDQGEKDKRKKVLCKSMDKTIIIIS